MYNLFCSIYGICGRMGLVENVRILSYRGEGV